MSGFSSYLTRRFRVNIVSLLAGYLITGLQIRWCFHLILITLGKIFSRHIEIFFSFFPENRIWHFMQIGSNGDNLHEVSDPSFLGKIRKISPIICLLYLHIGW